MKNKDSLNIFRPEISPGTSILDKEGRLYWTQLYYILKSGAIWYRREINNPGGYFKLWYSSDSGANWEELFTLDLTEPSVVIDLTHLYRHRIVEGAYNVDTTLTGTGYSGTEDVDWKMLYTTGQQLGDELVPAASVYAAVGLAWWNYVGANWSGDGVKLTSGSLPGLPLQKLNFWEPGETYRVTVEVNWISGWFEVFDGFTYTYYVNSSGVHVFDVTPSIPPPNDGSHLYLDSSSFFGDVLSLSIRKVKK